MILINLLPPELRKKESSKIVLPDIPIKKTLITAAAGVLALQVLLTLAALFFVWRDSAMQSEIDRLSADIKETRSLKSQTVSAQNKLKDIHGLTDKKFYWSSLLNAVSDSITKGVWLRSLSLGEVPEEAPAAPSAKKSSVKKAPAAGQMTRVLQLEGSVAASGQETAFIGKYVKSLKENAYFSELFRDIELSNINQRKVKDFDVYDFVLLCKFRKDKI